MTITFVFAHTRRRFAVAVACAALGSQTATAQLPLAEALTLADRAAFPNRIAAAASETQRGQSMAPLRGILPTLRLESGYLRTTDPIGAFGTTLRQRSATAADFDPAHLNNPPATGNHQAALVLEQPLFNADAWIGRRAAVTASRALSAQEQWIRLSTHADVVRAYYGAILAAERVGTLSAAASAAHAHASQAESMVRNGAATRSDALLASVHAGDADALLIEARGTADNARRQLELTLGQAPTGAIALPAVLPSGDRIRALASADTAAMIAGPRADVDAAQEAFEASHDDLRRARSAYLPRINGVARYDWNSATRPFGGDKSWTVGVMASWSPFSNASEIAESRAAAGREATARAQSAAAVARASLEVQQTQTALGVALARLSIAERSTTQSAEARRIVARKYEAGLATIVELLDAQAAETRSALGLSQSRYGVIVAAAERRLALGRDPATIAVLDDITPAAGAPLSH